MPLSDDELIEFFAKHENCKVSCVSRKEQEVRQRAALHRIEVALQDKRKLKLIEKITVSHDMPFENIVYRYFASKDVPIPKVYYNEYEASTEEGILLIEDMTESHRSIADWEAPIDQRKLDRIIDTVSQFHAASWDEGNTFLPHHLKSVESYLTHLDYLERDYKYFRDHQPFKLDEEQFAIYENSLSDLRQNAQNHINRISINDNTTRVHGDLNVNNLLYPVDEDVSPPYIIDLEAVRCGLCTEDLVMLFIHDLFHGEATLALFDSYYASLRPRIAATYSYHQFSEDCRTAIREGIFFPMKLFTHHGVEDEELVWKSIHAYKAFGLS